MQLCRVYIPNTFSPFKVFFLSLRSGLYYHLAIIKQKLLNYFYYLYIFWGRSTHPLPHPTGGMFRYTAAKYKKVFAAKPTYSSSKWKSSDDFPLSFHFFLSCFGSGWWSVLSRRGYTHSYKKYITVSILTS